MNVQVNTEKRSKFYFHNKGNSLGAKTMKIRPSEHCSEKDDIPKSLSREKEKRNYYVFLQQRSSSNGGYRKQLFVGGTDTNINKNTLPFPVSLLYCIFFFNTIATIIIIIN